MEQPISLNSNYCTEINSVRKYLSDKVELILFLIVFIASFFQLFPYYEGKFAITYYFSTIMFITYITFQLSGLENFNFHKPILFLYFLFICWLMYGLVSLFFISNHDDGLRHIHLRFMSFFNFYVITQFLTSNKRINVYEKIILICIIWNIGLCIWEITTLQHLPPSKFHNIPTFIPTGAFNNQNDLPAAILICCPILIFMKGKFFKYLSAIVLLLIFIIMGTQGSRLVMMALFPFLLLHFIFKTSKLYKITTILSIILIVSFILYKFPVIRFFAKKQIKEHVISFGFEAQSQRLGSTRIRKELYLISLEKFAQSKGLGVGIGNFEKTLIPQRIYSTGSINVPHSLFFETLATEGIIGFSLVFIIVFSILIPIFNKQRNYPSLSIFYNNNISEAEKRVLIFLLFFIVAVSVPSSIRSYFIYWNILGYNYTLIYKKNELSN